MAEREFDHLYQTLLWQIRCFVHELVRRVGDWFVDHGKSKQHTECMVHANSSRPRATLPNPTLPLWASCSLSQSCPVSWSSLEALKMIQILDKFYPGIS